MFNNSKYTKIYYRLIEKYIDKKHYTTEQHHIIPRSLGGSNDLINLVYVPTRVHFILHKLLCKMVDNSIHKKKMQYAIWRMMNPQTKKHYRVYNVTSTQYEHYRSIIKNYMTGENNPMKRPEVSDKFRRKRPEQSKVATERNKKYWETRKLPLVEIICVVCGNNFTTNNIKRICCGKSCAGVYSNKVRRLGDKERLDPHLI